jgi:MFS family permease
VIFGAMILVPLYYQIVRGDSAISTGLLAAPQGLGAAAGMYLSGRTMDRIGCGATALVGVIVILIASVPFTMLGAGSSEAAISVALGCRGLGIGMAAMPAMTAAFRALQPHQAGEASPQLTVLQRVGGSLGTALFAVVLQGGLNRAGRAAGPEAAAFATTFRWVIAITAVAALPTVLLLVIERRSGPARSGPVAPEVTLDVL